MIVKYKSSFEKDLLKIGEASVFEKTKAVILSVKSAERLQDIQNLKKIKGHKLAYRIKIGDYRIGFYFVNHEIELMRILHRKDIYKFFP
jgi:mRNA interferase RelE/StbE